MSRRQGGREDRLHALDDRRLTPGYPRLRALQRTLAIQTLRKCLSNTEYIEAMEGLGEEAVIDVGQAAAPPAGEALAPFGEEAIIDVGRAVMPPTSAFAGSRGGKPRYTNGVCCGWRFTQAGGQARANCQAPNACAKRVRAGWLPGIGDPAAPHNLGLPTTAPRSTPLTVAQAKALRQASMAAGYIPALAPVAVNPAALAEALAAAATPMATA